MGNRHILDTALVRIPENVRRVAAGVTPSGPRCVSIQRARDQHAGARYSNFRMTVLSTLIWLPFEFAKFCRFNSFKYSFRHLNMKICEFFSSISYWL